MKLLDLTGTLGTTNTDAIVREAKETKTVLYALVTLGNLLKLFKENVIVPYDNNRSGSLNKGRVKDMADNFNPFGFGQVTVSFHNGRLELVDAHHRMFTIEFMNDTLVTFGNFSTEVVSLKIVPSSERLSTYQTLNAGKSHGGADKIGNPDLAVGSINEEILVNAGVDEEFKKGHKQNLADLMLTYENHGPNFEIEDLFAARAKINKLLDLAKDRRSFSVKESTTKKLAAFTQKYQSIVNFAEQEDAKSEVISLVNSPGFFLLVGADYLTNGTFAGGFSTQPNKSILKKISGRKFPKIKEQTRLLARRNRLEISVPELKKCVE